jgi:capsular exopolysaccharide synthesis family protein
LGSVLACARTLQEAIQPTGIKGLEVLPCGPDVPYPSEMLNSEIFARTLEQLSKRYDRILVDSPPVMPVADSQILAAICNITLLVLRADKSTRKASQQARDALLSVGARVLGAVVNDVHRRNGHYGYYSGSGYYYHDQGRYSCHKKNNGERKPAMVAEELGGYENAKSWQ